MGAAWITGLLALAAVIVGPTVTYLLGRRERKQPREDPAELESDLNVYQALSALVDQLQRRNRSLERRLARCEAREKAREQ